MGNKLFFLRCWLALFGWVESKGVVLSKEVQGLSDQQQQQFEQDGFLVLRAFASSAEVATFKQITESALHPLVGPAEFEVDVRYPGAPLCREDEGGYTPRRLLHALARSSLIRQWATQPSLGVILSQVIQGKEARLCQNHHNCIMTKYPRFSSKTHWHQDVRYWSFERPELVSFWLALGEETKQNGALMLIPGSHRLSYKDHQLDDMKFLCTNVAENQRLLERVVALSLSPGDLVLFHCQTFHAAGANETDSVKLSMVFTAHAADNHPRPNTRSSVYPSLAFQVG